MEASREKWEKWQEKNARMLRECTCSSDSGQLIFPPSRQWHTHRGVVAAGCVEPAI